MEAPSNMFHPKLSLIILIGCHHSRHLLGSILSTADCRPLDNSEAQKSDECIYHIKIFSCGTFLVLTCSARSNKKQDHYQRYSEDWGVYHPWELQIGYFSSTLWCPLAGHTGSPKVQSPSDSWSSTELLMVEMGQNPSCPRFLYCRPAPGHWT